MDIYSNPSKYGLTTVFEVNVAESYEFDMLVIWKRTDGSFVYATDSGCSCPSPFESTMESDLLPASESDIREWFFKKRTSSGRGPKTGDLDRALEIIKPQFTKEELKRVNPWKTVEELRQFLKDGFSEGKNEPGSTDTTLHL